MTDKEFSNILLLKKYPAKFIMEFDKEWTEITNLLNRKVKNLDQIYIVSQEGKYE